MMYDHSTDCARDPCTCGYESQRADYRRVLAVKCPTCGSPPGRKCWGNGDMPLELTHFARWGAIPTPPPPPCPTCALLRAQVADLTRHAEAVVAVACRICERFVLPNPLHSHVPFDQYRTAQEPGYCVSTNCPVAAYRASRHLPEKKP